MKNLKNCPVNMEILEIKDKFIRSKDIDTGVNELYKDICDFYHIDRLIIGTKDVEHSVCIPILSYEKSKDKEVVHLGVIEDFEDFVKFLSIQTKGNEDDYISLCDNKRHFVGEECIEVYELLKKIGYEVGTKGVPKEYFLTYVKVEAFFSYTIMEIHDEKEQFLEIDMKMLDYIFSVVQLRIEKDILARQLSDETKIKNIIIDNEQTPICMVSKEDHRILYYNDKYKQVLPDIENCEYYYNLIGKDKEFSIKENINTKYLYVDGQYWIRKSSDIILSDGTEAYIIYAKSTIDYINELQGIDLLTSAYTSKGLAIYFKTLISSTDDKYVLCSLDIDKFKYINDLFGFSNGNILLKKVANKID